MTSPPFINPCAARGSHSEKQRVAGQERRHHEAGLTEDDHKKQGVNPDPVMLDECSQVVFRMKKGDDFGHGGCSYRAAEMPVAMGISCLKAGDSPLSRTRIMSAENPIRWTSRWTIA